MAFWNRIRINNTDPDPGTFLTIGQLQYQIIKNFIHGKGNRCIRIHIQILSWIRIRIKRIRIRNTANGTTIRKLYTIHIYLFPNMIYTFLYLNPCPVL